MLNDAFMIEFLTVVNVMTKSCLPSTSPPLGIIFAHVGIVFPV